MNRTFTEWLANRISAKFRRCGEFYTDIAERLRNWSDEHYGNRLRRRWKL